MQQILEDDSILSDNGYVSEPSEDSDFKNQHKLDQKSQMSKVAHRRQIEILLENKKLLSSIKDIYDY